jgi:hypothetical protein
MDITPDNPFAGATEGNSPLLQINYIGHATSIPNWPARSLEGLFDALQRWELDPRLNNMDNKRLQPHPLRAPFRHPAVSCAGEVWSSELGGFIYLDGPPIYPDAPEAVCFLGNFVGYSFAFNLVTNDPDLIARLDAAIARNMARAAAGEFNA